MHNTIQSVRCQELAKMEQPFRHRVLKILLGEDLIREDRVKMLLGWKNSGFSTDASVRTKADDSKGRENIARYINRAPLSVEKVEYFPMFPSSTDPVISASGEWFA